MSEAFPSVVEYRIVEYRPGWFAPVVARHGEFTFRGGRTFTTPEAAAQHAEEEVAFTKRFWAGQLRDRSNAAVVNGEHYRFSSQPPTVRSDLRGCGGRTFHLRNLGTGEVTTSSDLWWQGVIPDFARPAFPDTHEFVRGENR